MKIVKAPFNWLFSGFSGKTSWEWLELLIVPVGLAIGAFYLENRVEARQEQIAQARYEQEAQIADAQAKQETLDNYLDKMQGLLLDRNLRGASEESEVRSVARAITTTAIKELGSDRNALLTGFLQESGLIQKLEESEEQSVILLASLELSGAYLIDADLIDADLSGAVLIDANLSGADLHFANLSDADLRDAYLRDAIGLTKTQLSESRLCNTKLPEGIDLDPNRDCERIDELR